MRPLVLERFRVLRWTQSTTDSAASYVASLDTNHSQSRAVVLRSTVYYRNYILHQDSPSKKSMQILILKSCDMYEWNASVALVEAYYIKNHLSVFVCVYGSILVGVASHLVIKFHHFSS